MTAKEILKTKRLIGHLRTAQKIAEELEVALRNGGDAGALIGSMADELDIQMSVGHRCINFPCALPSGHDSPCSISDYKIQGIEPEVTADCECGLKIWLIKNGKWLDSDGCDRDHNHIHAPQSQPIESVRHHNGRD